MKKKLKLKYNLLSKPAKASIWYAICNVINKGIALFSTPIFTRLLTEDEYGTFTIFQSWYSILLIFSSLNVFLAGYTKGLLLFKDRKEQFTSSLLSLTTLLTCCFGLIYLMFVDFWTNLFELSPFLMIVMFVELLFMPALELWSAEKRFDYDYKKYVAISLTIAILGLSGGIVGVLLVSYKAEARIVADVLSKVFFAAFFFVVIIWKGKKFFVKEFWGYALRFNIPLIPHYLSNYVLSQSDRIMIAKIEGNEQTAYYSVAYSISMMMTLITTAINNAITPYIYNTIESGEQCAIKKTRIIIRPVFC